MKYDQELIGYINIFESISTAKVKDVFFDNKGILTFIVNEGDIGKAVGKKGMNVKRLNNLLKKRLRIVEFNNDLVKFIKNLIYPINIKNILVEDSKVSIEALDSKGKGILLGRNRKNLENLNLILKRYFNVEIKII